MEGFYQSDSKMCRHRICVEAGGQKVAVKEICVILRQNWRTYIMVQGENDRYNHAQLPLSWSHDGGCFLETVKRIMARYFDLDLLSWREFDRWFKSSGQLQYHFFNETTLVLNALLPVDVDSSQLRGIGNIRRMPIGVIRYQKAIGLKFEENVYEIMNLKL